LARLLLVIIKFIKLIQTKVLPYENKSCKRVERKWKTQRLKTMCEKSRRAFKE